MTIPQDIREEFGLLPHTEVDFIIDKDGVRIVKAGKARKPSRGEMVVKHLRRHGKGITMSTDEIMALTRGEG